MMDARTEALTHLLRLLADRDYRFVTPTPRTHAHVLAAAGDRARDLRDVFGWSLPFRPSDLEGDVVRAMEAAGVVEAAPGGLRSTVRVARLDDLLFLHSAFPAGQDSVFFGPDSYRFATLLKAELGEGGGGSLVDIGAGSGVGGIVAARQARYGRVVLTDSNPAALVLARANAAFAGIAAEFVCGRDLEQVEGRFDAIIANPPFMADGGAGAAYRDGGAMHGGALSLQWAGTGLSRLTEGGKLVLYTGAAIARGADRLGEALRALAGKGIDARYWEIDPDIHGEDLDGPDYADIERIAAVAFVAERRRPMHVQALKDAERIVAAAFVGAAPDQPPAAYR